MRALTQGTQQSVAMERNVASPFRRTLIFYATPNEGDWMTINLGLVISMSPVERPGSSRAA